MNVGTATSSAPASSPAQRWQRALGIRPDEARTVGLFFVHNFLLGIGTILVYVAANAILLENNPETSLPIAYLLSAGAMIAVGKLYGYYEHRLLLSSLAMRVLLAVVAMTVAVGALVAFGHSVAAAVAIMVCYRVVYLLTNLEFWGVSAVVFDTRQSKRLFGVISSGDMPAKALGAILAAFVHAHTGILLLVLVAFGAFLAAFYALWLTVQSHEVHAAHRPARIRREPSRLVGQQFGGSDLIFLMCLSLAALAAVAIEIEYNFFVNIKHRFHDQSDVITYVSFVLALTYGLAMLVKLLLSGTLLDKFGVRRSLLLLPLVALVGLAGLIGLNQTGAEETVRLVYFCGLYLVFEVVRRSLFDPVFLVLFQPLSPPQRLKGHTLAKGLYEPLGLGLAGLMIGATHKNPALQAGMPVVWVGLLGAALYLLHRTYGHYLHELNDAIGRRFLERDQLAMPTAAKTSMLRQLSSDNPTEVVAALGWLGTHSPHELTARIPALLGHPDTTIRRRTLTLLADHDQATPRQLTHVALTDAEPALREQAAYLLGRRISAEPNELAPLLQHTDLSIRQGAIRGVLELNSHDPAGRHSLTELANAPDPIRQEIALKLIGTLHLDEFAPVVSQRLTSPNTTLSKAAITAAGQLPDPDLTRFLVNNLTDSRIGRTAVNAMKTRGADAIPALRAALPTPNRLLTERITVICGTIRTPDSRRLLNELAAQPDLTIRGAALRALRRFPNETTDDVLFRVLLNDEIALAHRLLHGSLADPALTTTLDYELTVLLQRLFDVLTQLYDSETIAGARLGVGHPARERRANALELLDNLIPRAVYQTMQVLIDDLPLPERVRILDAELGPFTEPEPIRMFIGRTGETVFSAWTVSIVARSLSVANPLPTRQVSSSQSTVPSSPLMNHSSDHTTATIADYDRVLLLANTPLFSQTPENVLASITPIMKEEAHEAGDTIFSKGDLGTALYMIYAGEVSIRDGSTELARFGRGDFFGELALLDTEARSATAEALTDLRLLRLDQDDFFDLMEERGEVLRSIVRSLSGRIRRQNEMLTKQAQASAG